MNRALEGIGFEKDSLKTMNFNVNTEYEGVRDVLIAQGELPALPGQFPGTDLTPGSRDGEVT